MWRPLGVVHAPATAPSPAGRRISTLRAPRVNGPAAHGHEAVSTGSTP